MWPTLKDLGRSDPAETTQRYTVTMAGGAVKRVRVTFLIFIKTWPL